MQAFLEIFGLVKSWLSPLFFCSDLSEWQAAGRDTCRIESKHQLTLSTVYDAHGVMKKYSR
jgi:hypothetical protein